MFDARVSELTSSLERLSVSSEKSMEERRFPSSEMETSEPVSSFPVKEVPIEVFLHIMSFLNGPEKSLAASVSWTWRVMLKSDLVTKSKVLKVYQALYEPEEAQEEQIKRASELSFSAFHSLERDLHRHFLQLPLNGLIQLEKQHPEHQPLFQLFIAIKKAEEALRAHLEANSTYVSAFSNKEIISCYKREVAEEIPRYILQASFQLFDSVQPPNLKARYQQRIIENLTKAKIDAVDFYPIFNLACRILSKECLLKNETSTLELCCQRLLQELILDYTNRFSHSSGLMDIHKIDQCLAQVPSKKVRSEVYKMLIRTFVGLEGNLSLEELKALFKIAEKINQLQSPLGILTHALEQFLLIKSYLVKGLQREELPILFQLASQITDPYPRSKAQLALIKKYVLLLKSDLFSDAEEEELLQEEEQLQQFASQIPCRRQQLKAALIIRGEKDFPRESPSEFEKAHSLFHKHKGSSLPEQIAVFNEQVRPLLQEKKVELEAVSNLRDLDLALVIEAKKTLLHLSFPLDESLIQNFQRMASLIFAEENLEQLTGLFPMVEQTMAERCEEGAELKLTLLRGFLQQDRELQNLSDFFVLTQAIGNPYLESEALLRLFKKFLSQDRLETDLNELHHLSDKIPWRYNYSKAQFSLFRTLLRLKLKVKNIHSRVNYIWWEYHRSKALVSLVKSLLSQATQEEHLMGLKELACSIPWEEKRLRAFALIEEFEKNNPPSF
ncbi:MAG: hypothetical protein K0S07_1620 [Chlamydiales bacterium]|jgi:hypothetical protein|nr:hypothetical protein [Chlamydiales bacterium]